MSAPASAELSCFSCGFMNSLGLDKRVGRKDECQKCGADLHVCKNCQHYDKNVYNECREPQADRVQDRDRSNFCDYFTARGGASGGVDVSKKIMSAAEALFKKK